MFLDFGGEDGCFFAGFDKNFDTFIFLGVFFAQDSIHGDGVAAVVFVVIITYWCFYFGKIGRVSGADFKQEIVILFPGYRGVEREDVWGYN